MPTQSLRSESKMTRMMFTFEPPSSLSERDGCSAGQNDDKLPLLESLKRADSRERKRWLAGSEWLITKKRLIKQ